MKIKERSTVLEMCSRGLLFDHPTISPELTQRARIRSRQKASIRIRAFLPKRPKLVELQQKNILPVEDISIQKKT